MLGQLWIILVKTMPCVKTPYFYYGVMFIIINHLNKELINGITVDADIFSEKLSKKPSYYSFY